MENSDSRRLASLGAMIVAGVPPGFYTPREMGSQDTEKRRRVAREAYEAAEREQKLKSLRERLTKLSGKSDRASVSELKRVVKQLRWMGEE